MDASVIATPAPGRPTEFSTALPSDPNVVTTGTADGGDFAALIGGIVAAILLLLICVIAVLLWCMSRQKGSYVTNELDEEDVDEEDDEESVGSDTALQSKEPLKTKDEE